MYGGWKKGHLPPARSKFISTSLIERQNLTMRMHMRHFTRLTNDFSKKIENHGYAIALHFVYYNFVKMHKILKTTRNGCWSEQAVSEPGRYC